ncbi:MAG: hypothetical protein WBH40_03360 [Ignavibacteriaceae bacterium]
MIRKTGDDKQKTKEIPSCEGMTVFWGNYIRILCHSLLDRESRYRRSYQ